MAGVGGVRSFALGLLLGALIGGALGLLLAPERGEETRHRVRSRAQPGVDKIRGVAARLARKGETRPVEGEGMQVPEGETAVEESTSDEVGNGSESEGEDLP